jgi:holliday junction DNA helicase RuvB
MMPNKYLRTPAELCRLQLQDEMRRRRAATDHSIWDELVATCVVAKAPQAAAVVEIHPTDLSSGSNPLRPRRLCDVVGQAKLKPLLARLIDAARSTRRPLDHLLLVGASGTGKTTLATVIASELGTRVFCLKAPVDQGTLLGLRSAARDRDVIFTDEIHMQVSGDRRGITQACDPESFYRLLEDGALATPTGPLSFPAVTWIGATTDVGLLPEALSNRFVLQPRLAPYSDADMAQIAKANARALGLVCQRGVCELFAGASRGVPRQVNSYMRAARQLTASRPVTVELAREVVEDLCATTLDGLTESMQIVLRFLYRNCRRETRAGVSYSASVNTLATACGHGRDTKAISLLTEPFLLGRGLLEVRPSGRTLTPAGVERARRL